MWQFDQETMLKYARELTWAEMEKEAAKIRLWRSGQKVTKDVGLTRTAEDVGKSQKFRPVDDANLAKAKNLQQQAQKRDGREPWYKKQISDWSYGEKKTPITYGHAAAAGGLALGTAGGAYMLSGSGESQQKQAADTDALLKYARELTWTEMEKAALKGFTRLAPAMKGNAQLAHVSVPSRNAALDLTEFSPVDRATVARVLKNDGLLRSQALQKQAAELYHARMRRLGYE